MVIRILLADDHRLFREGLAALIRPEEDLGLVGTASDGEEAVRLAKDLAADVAILDVGMPRMNGLEAAARIRVECPGTRLLALSIHSDRRYVVGMFEAGCLGYLLKDSAFEELVEAIRTVARGDPYLSHSIQGIVAAEFAGRAAADTERPVLSPREREVLSLLAEGIGTKQIGFRFGISAKTVESHRRNIQTKLGMNNLADLTRYAIREGLTSVDP